MTLKPLGDRVLVKPAPKEEKTSTGLYIASAAQEKPQRGEVLAVGAGKYDQDGKRIALDVKVGDQVFYGKFGGTEVRSSYSFVPMTFTQLSRTNVLQEALYA